MHAVNSRRKFLCVRNLEPHEILEKIQVLLGESGRRLSRNDKPWTTGTKSLDRSFSHVQDEFVSRLRKC